MSNSKEYNARYYQEHRKEISEKRKQKYKENPEPYKEAVVKWRKRNKDKWLAYIRERRAKLKDIDEMENV